MTKKNKPSVTQRAYTLRLRRAPGECVFCQKNDCHCWNEHLWKTHEAVNKGAKAFGDWLLTLRGGLDHTLADAKVKGGKGKPDRDPTDEERKARRVLLALSWLSVESKLGAPPEFIVASGHDVAKNGNEKVFEALEEILKSRKIAKNEIKEWKDNCSASLGAAIQEDDAVWVNRSKAFDKAKVNDLKGLTRKYAQNAIMHFFGPEHDYFALPGGGNDDDDNDDADSSRLVANEGPEYRTLARQWISTNFGTGKKSNNERIIEILRKLVASDLNRFACHPKSEIIKEMCKIVNCSSPDLDKLCVAIGWITGRKSTGRLAIENLPACPNKTDIEKMKQKLADEADEKDSASGMREVPSWIALLRLSIEQACSIPFVGKRNHIGEFAVMLDHAARRVSIAHSWIKRAEAERRKFEVETKKVNIVPVAAKKWLDLFCMERTVMSGALAQYRIRRRAVNGWKEVVAAWGKSSCINLDDRIAVARALQFDPEIKIDKIGDIQLFEALAEDDAACVWHEEGDATKATAHQPLIDYVIATEAEFKKRHFKVPAYCHPDAFMHPIFCDFGNSRWDIDFSVREAAIYLEKAKTRCTKKQAVVNKVELILRKSSGNIAKEDQLIDKLKTAKRELEDAERELERLNSKHGMTMTLFDGKAVKKTELAWRSKRLAADLALHTDDDSTKLIEVSRANRLGRAASNVTGRDGVKISGLFEQADWNGRLQAPRKQLEAIAKRVADNRWDTKAKKMRDSLQWLVSFSAKLQPNGPWCDFASANNIKLDQKNGEIILASQNSKNDWRGLAYPFWHSSNEEGRKGMAKHNLSRLAGLRVLSVDLGHRYAAACAVWEAISTDKVRKACRAAGHEPPKASDLYLHLKQKVKKVEKGGQTEVNKTTIYRRIGADKLPNGMPHSAPWARLDRQFLIRLQGEEQGVREASNKEIWEVHQLEAEIGRTAPIIDQLVKGGWGESEKQKKRLKVLRTLGWKPINKDVGDVSSPSLSIDEMMFFAVRTMRLGLKRHADRARIAFAMTAAYNTMPGGRRYYFNEPKELSANDNKAERDNKRVEFIQDALMLWHSLAFSNGWQDDAASQLWDGLIAKLPGYKIPEEIGEEDSGAERRKKMKENRKNLYDVAVALAKDAKLRKALHEAWKKRWEGDDKQWQKRLRWFKDWILPRGKAAQDSAIRKVGGLSLTRLATLTEFRRKVQVGFFTRLKPDGTSEKNKERFGQRTLDALENMREQRVKQLASRIAESALGIGRMKRFRGEKDVKRPRERVDEPCHAIVIENLTQYRPKETRTRRENCLLMTWSSSKVKKYLTESCQLHGIHLREVSASYTSLQDSRTGSPGIRCQDLSVKEFMRSKYWRKQVEQAEKKPAEGKGDSRMRFLCELNKRWKDKRGEWEKAGVIRIPLKGGEIFVSAESKSPAAMGLQADLNAAANIGLRALTDPDWPGKWWYVPCDRASFKPVREKVDGSAAVNPDKQLRQPAHVHSSDIDKIITKRGRKNVGKANGIVNLWRDISSSSLECVKSGEWKEIAAYQNDVQCRVIRNIKEKKKGRDKQPQKGSKEADIPF